jgi:hypothetical protein
LATLPSILNEIISLFSPVSPDESCNKTFKHVTTSSFQIIICSQFMMHIPHLTRYYVNPAPETAYLCKLRINREHCRSTIRTSFRLHGHVFTCRNIRLLTMGAWSTLFSTEATNFVSIFVGARVWNYCMHLRQSIRLKFQSSLNRPLNRWH